MAVPKHMLRSFAREEEHVRRAEAMKEAQATALRAKWAEGHALKERNPKDEAHRATVLREELEVMARELVIVRRERLRNLYTEEMDMWERELAEKGLAIERPVV